MRRLVRGALLRSAAPVSTRVSTPLLPYAQLRRCATGAASADLAPAAVALDAPPSEVTAAVASATAATDAPLPLPPTELGLWPPDFALRAVSSVHDGLDLPWWLAVAACTVIARLTLLPIAVHGTLLQGRMQAMKPELSALQARLQLSGGSDDKAVDEVQALYARHGVSPVKMLALPLMQMPVFMSFFLGLRRLTEAFPEAHAGGAYWFVDLGARDETFALPMVSGLSALALVRLAVPGATPGMAAAEATQADRMKLILTAVTAVSLPVACTMPTSVLLFWVTNNAFSLGYTSLMASAATRRALGLPPPAGGAGGGGGGGALLGGEETAVAPVGGGAVARAKLLAAQSLQSIAVCHRDGGDVPAALLMQRRALSLISEAAEAVEAEAEASPGESTADEAAAARREALWTLCDFEVRAPPPAFLQPRLSTPAPLHPHAPTSRPNSHLPREHLLRLLPLARPSSL